ncbi:MAG: shikimate dehydrogenase [Actinomycetota bacterium]
MRLTGEGHGVGHEITGSTRAAGVIGMPVRHSLSPTIFNAAFEASGLDWAYLAFEVPEGAAGLAMGGMRALGLEGLSVTMPHKAAVIPGLDRLSPDAEALGAVNCVHREGAELVGHNTDGPGLVDALQVDEGIDLAGRTVTVVGAGGAARAVIRALAGAGVRSVAVVNRSSDTAAQAVAMAPGVARIGSPEAVGETDLVVNATPLGMGVVVGTDGSTEPLPVDPARLADGQVVVDLIYHPAVTPLLRAARERGLATVNGLGMLIHQAAHAFRHWTNEEAPLEAMSAAALGGLLHRDQELD